MNSAVTAPTFRELFTPKLISTLRDGYRLSDLASDAMAGLTVAVVALPLSMAIAIACGVSPERGLYTAIIGGFLVSALGGSRFQIGGPAGAFIVMVAATVEHFGVSGLLVATFLCGVILLLAGLLRLGTFIKYIPYPVTVAFTGGIALIILASQLKDLLGLNLAKEPGPIIPKLAAITEALPTVNAYALTTAVIAIIIIIVVRRGRPHWPSYLIAVVVAATLTSLAHWPIETIGTRFGGIGRTLPTPHLPDLSAASVLPLLPSALSFALLGGIESLLSAVVADSMTGRRHRSNCELVAQGLANIASSLFGGICVTGTIARTATNVRAGARSPLAGMSHSLYLLLFILIAEPLAQYIPLAALAGVLTVVCWNMVEKTEFATLLRASRSDAAVLLCTFGLVVFRDLATGIVVGFVLSALLFIHRLAQTIEIQGVPLVADTDRADAPGRGARTVYEREHLSHPEIVVYKVTGAFFFGAAAAVGAALDRIGERPRAFVIDLSAVPFMDSSGAATVGAFCRKAQKRGAHVAIVAAEPIQQTLRAHGLDQPGVEFFATVEQAMKATESRLA